MNKRVISGLAITNTGSFAVENFITRTYITIYTGELCYASYEYAVAILAGRFYPKSYLPYLLAVSDITPDVNTWNNLIFTGHVEGYYDHESKKFNSARVMGMESTSDIQEAYLNALSSTYASLIKMVNPNNG